MKSWVFFKRKWCKRKKGGGMLFFFFTKVEEMARVGSRDRHAWWRSKRYTVGPWGLTISSYWKKGVQKLLSWLHTPLLLIWKLALLYDYFRTLIGHGPLWRGCQRGHGPPTFLRVGKIKTHNKLSVECSPFKTKKQYSKLSRKTYLSSIINKTLPLFGEKAKKNKQLPSLPPKKNKVTLVIYFCEKTLPLFGKKVKKNTQLPPPSPRKKFFFSLAPPLSKCRRGPWNKT